MTISARRCKLCLRKWPIHCYIVLEIQLLNPTLMKNIVQSTKASNFKKKQTFGRIDPTQVTIAISTVTTAGCLFLRADFPLLTDVSHFRVIYKLKNRCIRYIVFHFI